MRLPNKICNIVYGYDVNCLKGLVVFVTFCYLVAHEDVTFSGQLEEDRSPYLNDMRLITMLKFGLMEYSFKRVFALNQHCKDSSCIQTSGAWARMKKGACLTRKDVGYRWPRRRGYTVLELRCGDTAVVLGLSTGGYD